MVNSLLLSELEKLKDKRESQLGKKELQLNKLTDEEVISELKNKGLPTFGTKPERLDRLKKFHGENNNPFSFKNAS